MKKDEWLAYRDLAWVEHIIAPPEEYVEDTDLFSRIIMEYSKIEVKTLLHLGCGAGGNDYTFKRRFEVTGVDISESMLEEAGKLNPDVTYLHGDMRTIRLKERFDAVAIPDSINYMTTPDDLRKVILTARFHLKPGGVLLIINHVREEFRENNFVYSGSKGDIEITLFENNCIPDPTGTTYEASFVWLIRRKGKLEIHSDTHTIGLFEMSTWLDLFQETGFEVERMEVGHSYEQFIVGEGEYPLSMFVCRKFSNG